MQPMILHATGRANLRRPGIKHMREMAAAAAAASSFSPSQAARVKRELLEACLTCPICKRLLRDATTISECLHTFCRKCIFEKLNDEEVDCCPICNIVLGCVPVEKLRPDHNLQDLRTKIFPFKRRKINAPEVVPSVPLPVRRKERSLSSLVVNSPRVTTPPGSTGRRTKTTAKRASTLRGLGPIIEQPKKDVNDAEDIVENSSQNRRQNSSKEEPPNSIPNKNRDEEFFKDTTELLKPLNYLLEAANRTKAVKSSPHSPVIKEDQTNGARNEVNNFKTKLREHPNRIKIQDEDNNGNDSVKVRASRRQPGRRRKYPETTSAQELIDAGGVTCERRTNPIWLSLVPSINQKGDVAMPQTSACYLRIKDGNLPVSFVQKYLVKKLNFTSEAEVEIACQGQILRPDQSLHSLADLWLQSRPPERVQTTVGSSGKDFVMVLHYSRRTSAP